MQNNHKKYMKVDDTLAVAWEAHNTSSKNLTGVVRSLTF